MTAYYAQPTDIANLPTPATAINITSSTNATPIVVTTAAAHGLQTGMLVIIDGHLVNTTANGVRRVQVLTTTTFQVKTFAGVDVAGAGIGGATGTVQSLALPGIDLPQDAVTNIDAASVNVPFEALADMTAWLAYKIMADMQILAGGSLITASTAGVIHAGLVQFLSTTSMIGLMSANAATFGGLVTFNSRTSWRDPAYPTDAATINVSASTTDTVMLAAPGAVPRTVIVDDSVEGSRIRIWAPATGTDEVTFNVTRADTTAIVDLNTSTVTKLGADVKIGSMIDLQVVAGVWRGRGSSGYVQTSAGW